MAYSTSFTILFSVAIFSLFPLSSSIREETVHNAAEILSNSGYISMSLTLQLVARSLISNAASATIFAPPDEAFNHSGQPSFLLLQIHFSPIAYSVEMLRSLPFGSRIPTLYPGRSLLVTTLPFEHHISINNVKIDDSPIFDDGMLVVFGTTEFLNPNFHLPTQVLSPIPSPSPQCPANSGVRLFSEVAESLRSRGYSIMAGFLDLQLVQFIDSGTQLTVFAPIDGAMQGLIANVRGWGSMFFHHVVACMLSFSDLSELEEGAVLGTFWEGFSVKLTHSGDRLLLNGVPLVFPDMYRADRIVVHGIHGVLAIPRISEDREANPPSGNVEGVVES